MKKAEVFIFTVICAFFPAALCAEIVTLKSGKQVEGNIVEKTDQYIKMDVGGAPVYYERKYIKSIEETKPAGSAAEAPSQDPGFYLKEGLRYGAAAQFDEAAKAFAEGLQKKPDDHNLKEASKIIENFKSGKMSKEYALSLLKGSKYLMDSQFGEAFAEFKEALRDNPEDTDLNYYVGICKYATGEFEEAVSFFKKAISAEPDPEIYYYIGASHYSLGRFSEALDYLKKAVEINPNDAEAHSIIGACYYFTGEPGKANEHLNKSDDLFRQRGDYLKSAEIQEFISQISQSNKP